jgi:transporter family-2 protein
VLGAVYVAAAVVLISKLGSAVLFTIVIFGQLVMAVLMDQYGWIGLEKHPLNPQRVAGIALVLVGAVLVRRS